MPVWSFGESRKYDNFYRGIQIENDAVWPRSSRLTNLVASVLMPNEYAWAAIIRESSNVTASLNQWEYPHLNDLRDE